MSKKIKNRPIEVVDITSPAMNSMLGSYFIGQTGVLNFGNKFNAWGGLINPIGSKVNMFLNAYTISNFSNQPLTAEGWLSSTLTGNVKLSTDYAAGKKEYKILKFGLF